MSNSETHEPSSGLTALILAVIAGVILAYYFGDRAYYDGADDAGVAFAAGVGFAIVAVIYGVGMAFVTLAKEVDRKSSQQGVPVRRFLWLLVLVGIVCTNAIVFGDIGFAIGFSAAPIAAGLVLSPVAWGISRGLNAGSWAWFDWLNAAACAAALCAVAMHFADEFRYLF